MTAAATPLNATLNNRTGETSEIRLTPLARTADVYRAWVERFSVYYALGVDGINLSLVVLTALVTMLAVVASFSARPADSLAS